MEGGNKQNINLESGLEISTSDMLVPISQPTFQHNWQRYQGKCLPNSLRFEKNGWAAGWNVYNFDYNTFRKQLSDNAWAQLSNLNEYAKLLALYPTKESLKETASLAVIPANVLVTGDVSINGNVITGMLNSKQFNITWDPGIQQLSMETEGFSIASKTNANYTTTVTVSDGAEDLSLDFDLHIATELTGDSITTAKMSSFDGTNYLWGNYSYNVDINEMTTPEGVILNPIISDNNLLTFNYSASIYDEKVDISYTLEKHYPKFTSIWFEDNSSEQMVIGSNPSTKFPWDFYSAVSDKSVLLAEDKDGVIVDWKLPLWATCGFTVERPDPNAKKCDNVDNYEVAVSVGTGLNTKVKWINVYGSEGEQVLDDNYRRKSTYIQFITNLPYRFNQILVGNTIEKSTGWQPLRHKINTGDVWFSVSRQYSNLRSKKTALFTNLLGDVYTWGSFTFKATSYFEQNNPYDWTDKNNCVYTIADISDILSIKLKGDADNTDTGDDEQFVKDNLPVDMSIIATLTGSTTSYSATQPAKTYEELYDAGRYVGGTYETVGVDDSEDNFWPFEKVPKFNLTLGTETIEGVYWTDGVNYIDNFDEFRANVLGDYDTDISTNSQCIIENENYNRTRVVKQYRAGYDFDYKTQDDFSYLTDYAEWKKSFDEQWNKYYPSYTSPTDYFDNENIYSDVTYTSYNEIELLTNVKPDVNYVTPGVYVHDKYAVPYGATSGLIMYNDAAGYMLTPFVYHHTKDARSEYTSNVEHEKGSLVVNNTAYSLPYYFGSATNQTLIKGVNNKVRFVSISTSAELTSAALALGINYSFMAIWDVNAGWQYIWTPLDPTSKNWFSNVLISYTKNSVKVSRASLNGVEQISKCYVTGDVIDGVKLAWPVWGHSATRITYPEMRKTLNINENGAFTITPVDTADLTDTSKIYWDRNDTDKSVLFFKVSENSKQPDDSQGGGNVVFKIEGTSDDSCLWYAKKVVDSQNNEITYSYYIPGIAYGGQISNTSGRMSALQSDYPMLKLNWTPTIYKIPVNVFASYVVTNSLGSQHKYFSDDKNLVVPVVTLGDFDPETMLMDLVLKINDVEVPFTYDVVGQKTLYSAGDIVIVDNPNVDRLTVTSIGGSDESAVVSMLLDLIFKNNTARFYKSSDADITIESASGSQVVFKKGNAVVKYDYVQQKVISPKSEVRVTTVGYIQHLKVEHKSELIFTAALTNVVNSKVTFRGYEVDLADFEGKNEGVKVLSTDIRTNKDKVIGYIKGSSQHPLYQLVRQQWNTTVEVENYWWVDDSYVLELNQENFVLKRKANEYDDWNGDRFEKVYEVIRSNILPTNILRYFVTNVYNDIHSALLVVLKEEDGKINVTLLNIRKKFEVVATFYISVRNRDIGKQLNDVSVLNNTAYLNTYNPLTNNQIISAAEWSNTLTDDRVIIGIHLSNNFDQWTVVFNLKTTTIECCIQGYGYVGLHGDLTGGQIPDDYFDTTKGFNSTVQPLAALQSLTERDLNDLDAAYEVGSKDKINQIDPKVVGTSEQQWYIQLKLYGIVSHLKYAGDGTFTKQILPMTNNYTASYKSPSFCSAAVGDTILQASPLTSMLTFEGSAGTVWTTICGLLGIPMIYSIAPRFGSIVHLQQTFGQYAYVHYNSSKSPPEKDIENSATDSGISDKKKKQTDPVLTSSFVFDKQKFTQEAYNSFATSDRVLLVIITALAGALVDTTNEKLSLNEEQNQSAVSDFGRKFLDNVTDNVSDMLSTNIATKSRFSQGNNSVVTGVKSLDMFYSTSDQQHVMAGPGFVEHQFVANCVAQSVTSLQVEGKIYQLYWCIRGLTTYQIELEIAMEEIAIENLRKMAENFEGATGPCAINYGAAIATALTASATALEYLIVAQKKAIEFITRFFDVLCANGVTCNQDGYVSRHALSVEGKHKYGEKNEVFMWPCWGINSGELKYTDEWVESGVRNTPWKLSLDLVKTFTLQSLNFISTIPLRYYKPHYTDAEGELSDFYDVGRGGKYTSSDGNKTNRAGYIYRAARMIGDMPHFQASCYGNSAMRTLPDDVAKIEGVTKFLPEQPFKNENISVSEPAFAPSMQQDYKIDETWDLGMYCTYGLIQWITVQDTKIIDCPPSNMVVRADFCGVACPYTAIEVKRGLSKAYMRPWAITPNTLAFNATGYNTILDNKLYHAFDGISYRLVDLIGSPGMNKNRQSFWYSIQVNDRFKRSNIIPANEMQGNFESEPVQAVASIDKLWTLMTVAAKEKGLEAGTIGEDKDNIRWSIPLFTEHVSTLPAAVKTMTAVPLAVVAGVTGLVIDLANNQAAYKAPLSVDFTIGKNVYRATEEYICSVQTQDGIDVVTNLVPSLGLKFIGATPTEAYFYSKSTRCYYTFTGSTLVKMDMMERFRDIQKGYWDFVNQEVVMPCLMTYKRLNPEVEDKDTETDNIIVPVLSKNQVSGELPVPLTTIFNDRSWYKCLSLPCGFAYQGPNRVIINRSVFVEYMLEGIKDNLGKWSKLKREKYGFNREYPEIYQDVVTDVKGVDGWTYNPFVLVTSPLGSSNEDDCLYEWEITFCWPIEMDLIYGVDNYAVVNITAETMTPGGKVKSRPTHVFLTKELFTRDGNYGYYSFRFQSKNGAGNRERLFIWSDQYIAISSLTCESKVVTSKRTSQLTQQLDVQKLNEL